MTKDQIRAVFMAHGFTIKEGQTDLKPYVYEAAEALLSASIADTADNAQCDTGKCGIGGYCKKCPSIADTAGAALYHPSLGGVANSVNAANVAAGIAATAGASKLVPHEPTKEMLEAGREQWDRMGFIKDIWQAMYCAATPASSGDTAEAKPETWLHARPYGHAATPESSVADAAHWRARCEKAEDMIRELEAVIAKDQRASSVADAAGASKLDQFDYARSLLPRDTFWGEHLTPAMVLHIAREAIAKGVR